MKERIYFVNLWGIGDLIPTLTSLERTNEKQVFIVSMIQDRIVEELITSIGLSSKYKVKSFRSKFLVFFYLTWLTFLRERIIFTSPLGGKSRIFAKLLSIVSPRIAMAKKEGNIYKINESLILKELHK